MSRLITYSKNTDTKEYIKECMEHREFTIPVFNLTGIENYDFMSGMLAVLIALETNCVPHATVTWNEDEKCFELKFFGFISKEDKKRIMVAVAQACPKDAIIDVLD